MEKTAFHAVVEGHTSRERHSVCMGILQNVLGCHCQGCGYMSIVVLILNLNPRYNTNLCATNQN